MNVSMKTVPIAQPLAGQPMHSTTDPALDALAAPLSASRQTMESAFMEAGNRLLGCCELLGEITRAQEAIPAELQGEPFLAAVELLARLQASAVTVAERQREAEDRLCAMSELAGELGQPIEALHKAVRNLRLIAVNARIIAAGMAGRGSDLDAFALEMVELGADATATVAAFAASHLSLSTVLEQAQAAGSDFGSHHGDTLTIVMHQLSAQLGLAGEHRVAAQAELEETSRLAARISGQIGEAVIALQIGDITRQRLEHVEAALADIGSLPTSPATRSLVLALQGAQLGAARDDFTGEVRQVGEALGQLAQEAGRVLEAGRVRSQAMASQGGSALSGLLVELDRMGALLDRYEAMRLRYETLRRDVTACVIEMRDHMQAIARLERAMRLLSINTSIRCSQYGEEGSALRVVAQEMRILASRTMEAAGEVVTCLARKDGMLDPGVAETAAGETHSLAAMAQQARKGFAEVVTRMQALVSTLTQTGPRALGMLQEAAMSATGFEAHASIWKNVIDGLEGARGAIAPQEDEPDPALMARLRSRYTMDAERRLHDRLCGHAVAAGPANVSAELDDILF